MIGNEAADVCGFRKFERLELAVSLNSAKIGRVIEELMDEEDKNACDNRKTASLNETLRELLGERQRIYFGDTDAQEHCIAAFSRA